MATLFVAPDELLIRDHIHAVAQHQSNGNGSTNGNGTGDTSLHAMIVRADGSVGSSRLAVVGRDPGFVGRHRGRRAGHA